MNAELASQLKARAIPRSGRARAVSALGPLTVAAGLLWAFVQPYRIPLLHPHGQGFWCLFVEPPLWVMLVGLAFALVVAPGVLEDVEAEERDAAARRARPLDVRDGLPDPRALPARRGDRRPGGVGPPPVAGLPVAGLRLRDGRPDVAGDGLLHELDHPHPRPRRLGAGDDARRRRRARPRPREAQEPALAALRRARLPRLGDGLPRPRAERLVLPALVVPPPPDRLADGRRGGLPARPRAAPPPARLRERLRAPVPRPRRDALLRPRPGADLRAPLAARRDSAPMRRAGFAAALAALAFPASAFAHASLEHTWPSFRERVETSPTSVRLNFDQAVTVP